MLLDNNFCKAVRKCLFRPIKLLVLFLTSDEKIELARDYAKQVFVADGTAADRCFHDLNSENPHVHIMLPTRVAGADGFEKKNRDWNSVDKLKFWQKLKSSTIKLLKLNILLISLK